MSLIRGKHAQFFKNLPAEIRGKMVEISKWFVLALIPDFSNFELKVRN